MRVTCPKCEFTGNIRDELIPPEGKNVNCPKCKTSIFVKQESFPKTAHTIPTPPTRAPAPHQISTLIAVAGCIVFLVIGILIGTQINKTDNPVMTSKTQPELQENTLDSTEIENTTPSQPKSNSPNPVDIDQATPPPPKSVPNESDFISTEYVDDFTIEAVIAKTEDMTSVQKEEFLMANGSNFLYKMIRGDFIVLDVYEMNSLYEDAYPAGMYSHLIYTKSSDNYSSNFYVYIGTNNLDFIRGISKDSIVYVEGYILNGTVDFDCYRFFIANAKIDFLKKALPTLSSP